jgi:hypothetical protein
MKGKINERGALIINGKDKYCPFQQEACTCGDWCVLFGEPHYRADDVILGICKASFRFLHDDFEDLRPKSNQADSK